MGLDLEGLRLAVLDRWRLGPTHSTTRAGSTPISSFQPHAVNTITTVGPGINKTDGYDYDLLGATTGRPGPTARQTLNWDDEGHLQSVSEGSNNTTYRYDADGSRWIQDDPTNRTLYLPGEEIVYNKITATTAATRYYTWCGHTIASITTGRPLTWLVDDRQGTQSLAVDPGSQAITQRRQTPYGTVRGAAPAWPNPHGFVGGTNDTTGLIHEGAREYDPNLGRFVSVDPVFALGEPQSYNGYSYADNSPIIKSDPTGLKPYNDADMPASNAPILSCTGASSCFQDIGKAPSKVVRSERVLSNGTRLTHYADGTTRVGGYLLPPAAQFQSCG